MNDQNLKLGPKARKLDRDEVIRRIKLANGSDRFEFGKMHYKTSIQPVVLRCTRCGAWFRQRPESLFARGGHPNCLCGSSILRDSELPDDYVG